MKKAWAYLIIGIVILATPSLFDFALSDLATNHNHTLTALEQVSSVLVTIYLINAFSDQRVAKQETVQFRSLRRVAFRSLSQTVNDVGRRLIGPIAGVDLFAAGIPQVSQLDVANYKRRLANANLEALEMATGFWGSIEISTLQHRITVLLEDPTFAPEMFRATSFARRELQSAFADWAPVMVKVPDANEDLAAGWPLADEMVKLCESWRSVTVWQKAQTAFDPSELLSNFEATIVCYRAWLSELQAHAELPTKGTFAEDEDWKS